MHTEDISAYFKSENDIFDSNQADYGQLSPLWPGHQGSNVEVRLLSPLSSPKKRLFSFICEENEASFDFLEPSLLGTRSEQIP